jgi:hypothetical protein
LVYFSHFGKLYQEKSVNPERERDREEREIERRER